MSLVFLTDVNYSPAKLCLNHLAVAGGYVVDALDFVNVSEMPAAHPPATARWY